MPIRDPVKRREYHRDYMINRLADDPEFKRKHLAMVRRNDTKYRSSANILIAEFKSKGCYICEETCTCCLSAHHLDKSSKKFNISDVARRKISVDLIKAELIKCICLCENCHRKVHAGVLKIPDSFYNI